jgi:hypothetical protein
MMQADAASDAASTAAGAQVQSSEAAIAEQRRQFNEIQQLLAPYVQAGTRAIGGFGPYQQAGESAFRQQQALAGILGPEAQRAAIGQIESSPFLQSQIQSGENALLQRASATGGLRGGNIQAALAQFRPQMLQQSVEQQYSRLGGLAGAGLGATEALYRGGQASAAQQASQAGALGANVAGLLGQQGSARAASAMAGAQSPFGSLLSAVPQGLGMYYGLTGQSPFGGSTAPTQAAMLAEQVAGTGW